MFPFSRAELKRRRDTQHDDTQHNDTQHDDTQHKGIQHYDSNENVTLSSIKKRYANIECNNTEWSLCWVSQYSPFIAEYRHAKCRLGQYYSECRYAECYYAKRLILNVVILSFVMLSVILSLISVTLRWMSLC
jgi:hypothetical protein